MTGFVHLRVHTEYSLVDSTVRIPELMEAAAKLRIPAIGVTDAGNLFAVIKAVAEGEKHGACAYGTEAMHVLRAEKGYIIVGQDTDGSVTPIDLGMSVMVSKTKDFIGRRSLARSDTARTDRKQLVGLLSDDGKTVLPEGGQLVNMAQSVAPPVPMQGHVTSSYFSPALGHPIAMALLKSGHQRMGQKVYCALEDGRHVATTVCSPVFYDPEGKHHHD